MNTYVALLRGINIGGKTVKMDALKKAFEELGCQNVRTLLASGNVVFETDQADEDVLQKSLEEKLLKVFGFEISIIIRPLEYIQEIVLSDPFKKVTVVPQPRLYVSFLAPKTKSQIMVPYHSPDKSFQIISMTNDELFSVLDLKAKTTDAMTFLDKKFGKNITTRNWNTVVKISMVK